MTIRREVARKAVLEYAPNAPEHVVNYATDLILSEDRMSEGERMTLREAIAALLEESR